MPQVTLPCVVPLGNYGSAKRAGLSDQVHHWLVLIWRLTVVLVRLEAAGGESSFCSLPCLQRGIIGLTPSAFLL